MQGYRIDPTISQEENVKKILGKDTPILHKYSVVPLDYRIADYYSPTFYITDTKLLFAFDEAIEVYDLSTLEIDIIGGMPKLDMRSFILESQPTYSFDNRMEIDKLKNNDNLTRISLNETKEVPKYYLVREGLTIQKSYKTWALYKLLLNRKNGTSNNEILVEMLNGYFSSFNQKTMLTFIGIFLVYVVLKLILGFLLPQIFSTVLDVLFGVIILLVVYWLYLSTQKNLRRYYKYYLSNTPSN